MLNKKHHIHLMLPFALFTSLINTKAIAEPCLKHSDNINQDKCSQALKGKLAAVTLIIEREIVVAESKHKKVMHIATEAKRLRNRGNDCDALNYLQQELNKLMKL